MTSSRERIVALSVALLTIVGAVTALPALALEPDSGSTYVNPEAPGATADLRATVIAERGDNVTRNGLKRVTLDFSADPDYSGSVAGITPRDAEIRVTAPSGNGTVPAGPVRVSANPAGDRLRVTLTSAYRNVQPGDEISVRLDGVRNTEIAIPDPQGPRGFALRASVSDPQGNTDGPVELRYSIDPNATGTQNATGTNATGVNATGGQNATGTNATDTNATGMQNATAANASGMNATGMQNATSEQNATGAAGDGTTDATSTSTTSATATSTSAAAETTTAGGTTSGGATETTTTTTGPGFGALAAVIALLAISLLATRRRG